MNESIFASLICLLAALNELTVAIELILPLIRGHVAEGQLIGDGSGDDTVSSLH